jgi:predicted RNA-binding protein YlxR (DUF448 family)
MVKKNIPARMCIVCKIRLPQKSLNRFQVKDGILKAFDKQGRSFYVCEECLSKDLQKLIKTINKQHNLKLPYNGDKILKETIANG